VTVSARFTIVDPENEDTVLPPGQRDTSGFWYPEGYSDPKTLVRRRSRRDGRRPTIPRRRGFTGKDV